MIKILYIGNNLKSKKHNISYITVLGHLLETEGFKMDYASSKSNKILRLLDMIWSVLSLRNKIDLVLLDTYSSQNFYYALIVSQLCRGFKIKYIPILHGGNLPSRLKNNPKLSGLIFKNAQHNVSPSLYLKRAFETYGYENIIYIPNTIQVNDYPFNNKNYDTPRLLWVRSFSEIYNPKLAIHVFNDIKKSYPEATLCMVGPDADGTLKDVKALATALNLEVEFTGRLTKKEWILVSEKYNTFINTTNIDNTPVSVLEAMALGLPIVSTDVGGMPFLIAHAVDGLLVPPKDATAMANAIIQLKTDDDLRLKVVSNARSKVENFSWKVVKTQWKSLLS